VGVIGFGYVGRHLAKRLSGFGVRLLVYDPYVDAPTIASYGGEKVAQLERIFREGDFVTLHARLTDKTRRFVGREQFDLMKPTAYFINNARSRMVRYDDLYEVLREGRIAGAALDVFDDEPLPEGSPWLELENVTFTPHIAGSTEDTWESTVRMVAEAVREFSETGRCLNTVNAKELEEHEPLLAWDRQRVDGHEGGGLRRRGPERGKGAVNNDQASPRPRWVEQDMDRLWENCCGVVKQALDQAGIDAGEIAAIGVSGHGDGIYMVDERGRPVRAGVLSLDSRAHEVAERWQESGVADRALELTGQKPFASMAATLLTWFREHEPESFERTGWILYVKDWIRYKLTGEFATDTTEASSGFTDVNTQKYSRRCSPSTAWRRCETSCPRWSGARRWPAR
jgi:hypothetical protein